MLSWAPLRAVCLASLLLSWIACSVIAIPVPIHPIDLGDQGTRFTSNTDGLHGQRLQAHAALPPHQQAHPGAVVSHAVPNPHPHGPGQGHLMGSVVADPRHQHNMPGNALAAHVQHIEQHIGPGYKIDAHHTEGNSHVMFHATPLHHDATVPPHHGVRHAVLNPGDNPNNVLVTSNSAHRSTIHHQLSAKTHPQTPGAHPDPLYHKQTGPGGTTIGRIPIADEKHRHGMTDQDLQAHAHYVHKLVTKGNPELKEKVHVHVTHNQGDGHVNFHVVPGQQDVSGHEIQAHLARHGDAHYSGAPIARDPRANPHPNADHKYTWHGSVPAHTTAQMSPAELRVYAQHAKDRIVALKGLQGPDADNMVMAAVHKEGDSHVHFHTQPTHSLVMNRNDGLHPGRPGHQTVDPVARKLSNAISAANGGEDPWHHAEAGALYDSLHAKGVHQQPNSFNQQVQGHVVGVAGAWNQPCPHCKNTLNHLGVTY